MPNRGTDYLPRPATSLPSNRKGSGTPYSMRAASGCTGFRRTFDSPGMIADGTSRSALRFSRTQVTPSAASARGAGAARQRAGSRGSGTDSTEMPRGRRATQATELDPREAPDLGVDEELERGERERRARVGDGGALRAPAAAVEARALSGEGGRAVGRVARQADAPDVHDQLMTPYSRRPSSSITAVKPSAVSSSVIGTSPPSALEGSRSQRRPSSSPRTC